MSEANSVSLKLSFADVYAAFSKFDHYLMASVFADDLDEMASTQVASNFYVFGGWLKVFTLANGCVWFVRTGKLPDGDVAAFDRLLQQQSQSSFAKSVTEARDKKSMALWPYPTPLMLIGSKHDDKPVNFNFIFVLGRGKPAFADSDYEWSAWPDEHFGIHRWLKNCLYPSPPEPGAVEVVASLQRAVRQMPARGGVIMDNPGVAERRAKRLEADALKNVGSLVVPPLPDGVSEATYRVEHERAGIELARDWTDASRDTLLGEIERLRGKINADKFWPTWYDNEP